MLKSPQMAILQLNVARKSSKSSKCSKKIVSLHPLGLYRERIMVFKAGSLIAQISRNISTQKLLTSITVKSISLSTYIAAPPCILVLRQYTAVNLKPFKL